MATQKVVCSYQEIIDLHTESDTVSVVGVHTPTGDVPKQMFSGFYKQFKKFKYLGASLAMVPAARLPADPLQVSYEAGEPTIDPRDMLNPILFHGCHGNDMGAILNQLYQSGSFSDFGGPSNLAGGVDVKRMSSAEITSWDQSFNGRPNGADNPFGVIESLYYKALTDNTWLQAHPQRGFRKSGLRPRVYELVADRQYLPITDGGPSNTTGEGWISPQNTEYYNGSPSASGSGTLGLDRGATIGTASLRNAIANSELHAGFSPAGVTASFPTSGLNSASPRFTNLSQQFFTNKTVPLGWLDTYQVVTTRWSNRDPFQFPLTENPNEGVASAKNAIAGALGSVWQPANLPRVYMGMIMLPPAYKTEQYFRLVIKHNFAFAGFRGISMQSETIDETLDVPSYFNANGDAVQVYHPDQINNRPYGADPLMLDEGVEVGKLADYFSEEENAE